MGRYVKGDEGNIQPNGRPFYQIQLNSSAIDKLLSFLDQIAQAKRLWHVMVATLEHPSRLRLYQSPTPNFEQRASQYYVRGTLFRISGQDSINISFSCEGALLIADRLREARPRVQRFVLFRVASQKKDMLEFVPDVEIETVVSEEHDRLNGILTEAAVENFNQYSVRDAEGQNRVGILRRDLLEWINKQGKTS